MRALLAIVVLACAGCGASALHTHATVAAIASATMATTAPLVVAGCQERLAACADAACVESAGGQCRGAAAAHETMTSVVRAYIDALRVAVMVDEEGEVLPALLAALRALVAGWADLRAAVAPVGVTLPPLPPLALALTGGGS